MPSTRFDMAACPPRRAQKEHAAAPSSLCRCALRARLGSVLFRQVAAKVEDEALWILATVEKHNEKKGLFVVVDDDAGDGKRRWVGCVFSIDRATRLINVN